MTTNTKELLNWKCAAGHTWTARMPIRPRNRSYCIECQKIETSSNFSKIEEMFDDSSPENRERLKNNEKIEFKLDENFNYTTIECDKIRDKIQDVKEEDSIAYLYPAIARYWNYERNEKGPLEVYGKVINRNYWWKCEKGHEWVNTLQSMIKSKNHVCSICAGFSTEYALD